MKAILTSSFNSGLGDMYLGLYQIYYLQEELIKIGYEVKTIIDFGKSPYKIYGEDREIFKRVFNFNILNNFELTVGQLDSLKENFTPTFHSVYNYEHIHSVFVDEKNEKFDDINHVKHSWYYRDDLPMVNLFSEEITRFCEHRFSQIEQKLVGIHYRPFSSDNEDNIERDLLEHKKTIDEIILENENNLIFVSTNKQLVKDYCQKVYGDKVYINPFVFPNVHDGIRELKIDDDSLFEILKETICDMYFLSRCEKIYRISDWFSAFLSFACLYNQTGVSNLDRFIPRHPIRKL